MTKIKNYDIIFIKKGDVRLLGYMDARRVGERIKRICRCSS
nr:MAG TPA: hypothetical protein [Caudoviricetes sp.]